MKGKPMKSKRSRRRARLVAAGKAGRRGAEPSVTLEVVKRVGQRMAKGLPLHYALALEEKDISEDAFHKALARDRKLSTHLARWKAKFIEESVERLSSGEMADLKWLLSRRHPDLFAEKVKDEGGGGTPEIEAAQRILNLAREGWKAKQNGDSET